VKKAAHMHWAPRKTHPGQFYREERVEQREKGKRLRSASKNFGEFRAQRKVERGRASLTAADLRREKRKRGVRRMGET